jgi:hypothetical protein
MINFESLLTIFLLIVTFLGSLGVAKLAQASETQATISKFIQVKLVEIL